jgi:uncharacterized phage-associated protein
MPTKKDAAKAKYVIRALLIESNGEFSGKTRLFKAFYAAHLFHWQKRKGALTDYPIVHMPRGPAIDNADPLLGELKKEGVIEISSRKNGPYDERVYKLVDGRMPPLTEEERESIREAIIWISDKSATELSEITHENSRSWAATTDGQEMNIYLDLLSDDDYAEMMERKKELSGKLDAVFGEVNQRRSAKAPARRVGRS